MSECFLIDDLLCHVGQTVTIFTTSGGLSGCGFTGVLAGATPSTVKLITDIGAAPSCPVGSSCSSGYGYGGGYGGYGYGGYGYGGGYGGCGCGSCGCGCGNNWLGSVTEIPICQIASFTHHAI